MRSMGMDTHQQWVKAYNSGGMGAQQLQVDTRLFDGCRGTIRHKCMNMWNNGINHMLLMYIVTSLAYECDI